NFGRGLSQYEEREGRERYQGIGVSVNLWSSPEHALDYVNNVEGNIPHRTEGEAALLEHLPARLSPVLDLGTGTGRLLALLKQHFPDVEAVGLDFSPTMLELARQRFAGDTSITILAHDLDQPLPELGKFDAVVSSFAIHHVVHERKHALYAEIFPFLTPRGVF